MTRASGKEWPRLAGEDGFAIPAFNISNLESAQGVLAAAEAANAPLYLQISPGAIAYAGYETLTHLAFDLADLASVPAIVHLDHCRDPELIRRAIADGYGSVMFDGSRLAFEENVRETRLVLQWAATTETGVEAELGVIGGREDSTLEAARLNATSPAQAARFVDQCPVDVLAPAVGTLHRMPDDSVELDVALIGAIAEACGRPLALHGGSGIAPTVLAAAIAAGVAKINISSRVGRALASGICSVWAAEPDELDPRRFLGAGRDAVAAMAGEYFAVTGAAGRAGRAAAVALAPSGSPATSPATTPSRLSSVTTSSTRDRSESSPADSWRATPRRVRC